MRCLLGVSVVMVMLFLNHIEISSGMSHRERNPGNNRPSQLGNPRRRKKPTKRWDPNTGKIRPYNEATGQYLDDDPAYYTEGGSGSASAAPNVYRAAIGDLGTEDEDRQLAVAMASDSGPLGHRGGSSGSTNVDVNALTAAFDTMNVHAGGPSLDLQLCPPNVQNLPKINTNSRGSLFETLGLNAHGNLIPTAQSAPPRRADRLRSGQDPFLSQQIMAAGNFNRGTSHANPYRFPDNSWSQQHAYIYDPIPYPGTQHAPPPNDPHRQHQQGSHNPAEQGHLWPPHPYQQGPPGPHFPYQQGPPY